MEELKELREICASCGQRRGEHYGPGTYREYPIRVCTRHKGKWINNVPIDYDGTFWAPSGLYEDKDGHVIAPSVTKNPNMMFKMRKRKR